MVICNFLESGLPVGYVGDDSLLKQLKDKNIWKCETHRGAQDFPEEMIKYLKKENSNCAVLGPFKKNLFKSGIKISPLNSLPKKETSDRRVILD